MKKNAPGFILEKDQKIIIDELSNEEAGIILKAIYEYEATKEEPPLDKTLKIVFKQIKVKLDFYDEKYNTTCETNRKNIQNYWNKVNDTNEYDRIRSNTMATNKRKEKKSKVNKIKENKIKCESELSHICDFVAPTLAEIFNYSKSLNFDDKEYCEKFYNHYESIGWVNGTGQEIKNWKLVFNNWLKKDKKTFPEWIDEEIQKEVLSEEEKKQFEEIMDI